MGTEGEGRAIDDREVVADMVTSYSRGHKTYLDGMDWRFTDNNEIDNNSRECKRCGCSPNEYGYDACLGRVDGATSACCGHGVEEGYTVK